MISLQRSMHSSQMYTPGPAMSFLTCFCDFPQKEHFSRSPPSPMRATWTSSLSGADGRRCRSAYRETVPPSSPLSHLYRQFARVAEGDAGTCLELLRRRESGRLAGAHDLVDQAVLHRLAGGEDLVALDVLADLRRLLTRVPGDHLLQELAHPEDLPRLDLDVGRLALAAAGRLVDQDAGVLEREPLALGAGGEQHGRRRGRLAHADRLDLGLDELHRVVDRRQRGEGATGA